MYITGSEGLEKCPNCKKLYVHRTRIGNPTINYKNMCPYCNELVSKLKGYEITNFKVEESGKNVYNNLL